MTEKELKQLKTLLKDGFRFLVIKPRVPNEKQDHVYMALKEFVYGAKD